MEAFQMDYLYAIIATILHVLGQIIYGLAHAFKIPSMQSVKTEWPKENEAAIQNLQKLK